jgi:hypothetical protein
MQDKCEEKQKKPRGRPVQKGQVLNPNGRPKKGTALTDLLNEYLDKTKFGENKITGKQAVIQKLFQLAMQGDVGALKYLYDRIDGPIKTELKAEHSGPDGGPIKLSIDQDDANL